MLEITREDKLYLKLCLGFILLWLYSIVLSIYNIRFSTGMVILGILSLLLILWMPPEFIEMIRNFGTEDKRKGEKWLMAERIFRILTILLIKTIHDTFWRFITKYYPFSLLHRDRLFHAENSFLRTFILEMEEYAKKEHIPFLIQSADVYSGFSRFSASRMGGRGNKDVFLDTVREKLEAKYRTIYVTPEEKGFTIKIPTTMVRGASGED